MVLASDATIASPNQPQTITKEKATHRMIPGSRQHAASIMGKIGENDPKCGRSQLLGVLGVGYSDGYVDSAISTQLPFWGGLPRHYSLLQEVERSKTRNGAFHLIYTVRV